MNQNQKPDTRTNRNKSHDSNKLRNMYKLLGMLSIALFSLMSILSCFAWESISFWVCNATWTMFRNISWSSCLNVGMTLWILEVSSFTIVDTGICQHLDGTKTVRGSFWGWSCNTTKSYMALRRPAFSRWYRISACFADCSSSWQFFAIGPTFKPVLASHVISSSCSYKII